MALLNAFKAVRPAPELAGKVAALPYDVMSSDEAREMVKGNPYSFLHIDKSEVDLDRSIDLYDKRVYEKASETLKKMIEENTLVKDMKDNLYIYKEIMDGVPQVGLVGCVSIDDYMNDIIKKHEFTRADKEQDRINHVDYTNSNTGPIFLTYRSKNEVNDIINHWMAGKKPVYDFVSEDGVTHTVWVIDDSPTIEKLVSLFRKIDYLYIADGHHRAASAVKVGLKRRQENPSFKGDEEFNFFLAVLFPDEQLRILDYNRVVKDLNGNIEAEFIEKIKSNFEVEEYKGQGQYKPEKKHNFGMYLGGKWYKIAAKPGTFDEKDSVERLDVSILQKNLLSPVLGIADPRTDKRIEFVGGIRGLSELEKMVNGGMKVAFSMFPTTIEDLMDVADAGRVMPPKSTWFEPKLRSGLFIHELK